MAELEPTPVPPAENAATYLMRISSDAQKLYAEIAPSVHAEDYHLRIGLTADQIKAVEEAFQSYPDVLPALAKAANCSQYAWPHDYTLPPMEFITSSIESAQEWRTVARILDGRARYLASMGKSNEAAETYLQLMKLARLQSRDPLLIAFLVNAAIRQVGIEGLNDVLQTGTLSPETHAAIDVELGRQESFANFVQALVTERVIGIERFRELRDPLSLLRPHWSDYLDFMASQIEMGDISGYKLEEPTVRPQHPVASSIVPAIEASRNTINRVRGLARCVRIVNALYAQAVADDSVDLDSLGLPPDTLIDPFTGSRLLHQETAFGWKVGNRLDIQDGQGKHTDFVVTPPPAAE